MANYVLMDSCFVTDAMLKEKRKVSKVILHAVRMYKKETCKFGVNGKGSFRRRPKQKVLVKMWENQLQTIFLTSGKWSQLDHFPDVRKVIEAGKGAQHEINDILLTRYACYLIAQNSDSRKLEIAFAQNYFAVQTCKVEIIEQRLLEVERVKARAKLQETEKNLSGILYERGVDNKEQKEKIIIKNVV